MVWLLRKAVYGLNDAGRRWYFRMEQVLTSLGCKKSLYDHCLFSADCLMKRGMNSDALLDIITSGFLPQEDKNKKGGEDERRVV